MLYYLVWKVFEEMNIDVGQHEVYRHSKKKINQLKMIFCGKEIELTGGPGVNCRSMEFSLGQSASVNEFTELGCP